jgi:hypothetical protein
MNWKNLLNLLVTGAISGAAAATAGALSNGNTKAIGITAGVGALVGIANLLRPAPVPPQQ